MTPTRVRHLRLLALFGVTLAAAVLGGCSRTGVETTPAETVSVTLPDSTSDVTGDQIMDVPPLPEPGSDVPEVTEVPGWHSDQAVPTEAIIGATEAVARQRAEQAGYSMRVVRVDGEALELTLDYYPNRVNVSLANGRIVAVDFVG